MLNKNKVFKAAFLAILANMSLGLGQVQARIDDNGFASDRILGVSSSIRHDNILVSRVDFLRGPYRLQAWPILPKAFPKPDTEPFRTDYNIFRSTVVPVGNLAAFDQWSGVAPQARDKGIANCDNGFCATSRGKRMAAAAKKAASLPPVAALRLINLTVNKTIKYRSDRGDHWASLAESAKRGYGDCEDYAIAKMQLLSSIGFKSEQLQFVVLKDTRKQLYHAVLAVHVNGQRYVLDNLSNTVASDKIFRSYVPIASFAGEKSFIHGFKGKSSGVAKLGKGGMSAIRLGEGN